MSVPQLSPRPSCRWRTDLLARTRPTGCAVRRPCTPILLFADALRRRILCGLQVDLYNRLYRERIIFLGQQIDDQIANQIIGVMLYLDSEVCLAPFSRVGTPLGPVAHASTPVCEHACGALPRAQDNTKPMYMYINSPGGSVMAGFSMFDTMRHVKSEVSTINVGLAASMGSLLLVGGAKGKRLALPHSRVMIHQPAMGGIQGQASDIKVEAEMILGIRERVVRPPPALVL